VRDDRVPGKSQRSPSASLDHPAIWPQGLTADSAPDAVPGTLDWDLWLGIANSRPFTTGGKGYPTVWRYFYQPFNWRAFTISAAGRWATWRAIFWALPTWRLKAGDSILGRVHVSKEGVSDSCFQAVGHPLRFSGARTMPRQTLGMTAAPRTPEIPGVPKANCWAICGPAAPPPPAQGQGSAPPQPRGRATGSSARSQLGGLPGLLKDPRRCRTAQRQRLIGDKGIITCGT